MLHRLKVYATQAKSLCYKRVTRVSPILLTLTLMDVGFHYTYLPEEFIEEQNAVYSENALVVLPLNPTYVLHLPINIQYR